ncbi:hypothetical protein TIFTF001_044558 [Ficus carica]|uniref:Uncharacterized protein n=1 Tax=Ficus carica TaxID=3494 RepID=A0AA88CUX8_FICCA|nr:hypothetical protein TIFTF001_044558 [Ficus carica]
MAGSSCLGNKEICLGEVSKLLLVEQALALVSKYLASKASFMADHTNGGEDTSSNHHWILGKEVFPCSPREWLANKATPPHLEAELQGRRETMCWSVFLEQKAREKLEEKLERKEEKGRCGGRKFGEKFHRGETGFLEQGVRRKSLDPKLDLISRKAENWNPNWRGNPDLLAAKKEGGNLQLCPEEEQHFVGHNERSKYNSAYSIGPLLPDVSILPAISDAILWKAGAADCEMWDGHCHSF